MFNKAVRLIGWLAWIAAVVIAVPGLALAWGPGAHIETSTFILEHLVLLAPAIRKIISAFPAEFIYGSVAPDMVLGKRLMKKTENNHLWSQGRRIMAGAKTAEQEAFAWGYLSHLAADTIAHNHFVPDRVLDQIDDRKNSHMLQELFFDAALGTEVWAVGREVASRRFDDCERLLIDNLGRTPLPKSMNRRLFRGGVLLVQMGAWQKVIERVRARYEDRLDEQRTVSYLHRVHQTTLQFLQDPEAAPCLKESPTGGEVLPAAMELRKTLESLNRRSLLEPSLHKQMVSGFNKWRDLISDEKTS